MHFTPINTTGATLLTAPAFLTPDECSALCALIDQHATPSQVWQGTAQSYQASTGRTSSTAILRSSLDPLIATINQRIATALALPVSHGEVLQGQRYEPGQAFTDHTDFFKYKWYHLRKQPQRTWTCMIYLNDDCSGGATEFPKLALSFAPQTGTALAWHNLDSRGRPNPLTLHAGRPVVTGTKYVLTKWFQTGPISTS